MVNRTRQLAAIAVCSVIVASAGCGGGGGDGGNESPLITGQTPPLTNLTTYTISGTTTGLAVGKQVALLNNSGNATTVSNNGTFSFSIPVAQNGSYAITVSAQPDGQTCTVTNGTGAGMVANVSDVTVNCSVITYTIAGAVSGLGTGKQLALLNNSGNPTTVSTNGAFSFNTPVAQNGSYAITVSAQPDGQTCSVSNGSGAKVAVNVSNVTVTCSDISYTISGAVSGMGAGKQVTLLNNSGNPTTVSSNGAFSFSTPVAQNGSYAVAIATQPNGQSCVVNNGSGANISTNVSNIQVACSILGVTTTKIGVHGSRAFGVAIQVDGKVVVAGVAITSDRSGDVAVARYNTDGSLDTSFGEAGVVTTNISERVESADWVRGVALQNDGKIVRMSRSDQ